jgi:uncharacterized cupredoxin-like copper-binding protein
MPASPPDRRRLGADRAVALLVILLSLPTLAWQVATDDAVPAVAADVAGEPGRDQGPMDAAMHADADHTPMHPGMHDTVTSSGDTEAGSAEGDAVAADSTTVVRMTEFAFDMPATYAAGTHTFEVVNDGVAPHEFALGAVGDHHSHVGQTEWLDGGATERLTVDLEPGTYEVGCHVPGHYEAGMKTTITVTE